MSTDISQWENEGGSVSGAEPGVPAHVLAAFDLLAGYIPEDGGELVDLLLQRRLIRPSSKLEIQPKGDFVWRNTERPNPAGFFCELVEPSALGNPECVVFPVRIMHEDGGDNT